MARFASKVRIGEGVGGEEGPKRMSGTGVPMSMAKITTSKGEAKPNRAPNTNATKKSKE